VIPEENRMIRPAVVAWTAAGAAAVAGLAAAITVLAAPSQPSLYARSAAAVSVQEKHEKRSADRREARPGTAFDRRRDATSALHGEIVSGTGTITVQRGTVTAVSPTSLKVTSADGYTATYRLTAPVAAKAGQRAVVTGVRDGAALTATAVR
jgi:hypothetical protein